MLVSVITVREDKCSTRICVGCEDMADVLVGKLKSFGYITSVRHAEERPSRTTVEQLRAQEIVCRVESH